MFQGDLPWPPSVNKYRGVYRGRIIMAAAGREYRKRVLSLLKPQKPMPGRLRAHIIAHPPDMRKRDLDNLLKPALDALEHAKVFEDDGQIDVLKIVRAEVEKPGRLSVRIEEHHA